MSDSHILLARVRAVLVTALGDTPETLQAPERADVLKRRIAEIDEALKGEARDDDTPDALTTRLIAATEAFLGIVEEISRLPPDQRGVIGARMERETALKDRMEALDGVLDG